MLLLLAALLAAEASIDAGVGLRGERRASIGARAGDEDLRVSLAAMRFAGPQAPEREELSVAAETEHLRGEFKVVPMSAGLLRAAAELGVHSGTWGFVLVGRAASLGRRQLRAAGARAEVEGELAEGMRAGGSFAAWALQLDAPRTSDRWGDWGKATLDWGERWELGAWLSKEMGDLSLTPALSLAQSTALEGRASLQAELQLGPVKLRAEAAVGRARSLLQGEVGCGLVLGL
ncbi:MAG: hypothetical protein E6J78_04545 [Deltaproteobacteria bacterium]|nr:MAG: hypothetical protein E6J78_04545 [Deltaproteobacteria bacterium]